MELDSLSRPTSEFQDYTQSAPSEEEEEEEEEEQKKAEILASSLRIKIPSTFVEFKEDDENDGGFRTPTSPDQRIPLVPQCPPAPRKPKPPLLKRKASSPQILLVLDSEFDSLFTPPLIITDLAAKMKKVRTVKAAK
ncbi:cyclin-dependent protein kinase inhibitor SMR12-like [Diospyros lotus]|uniref:cyclin-dependent protein kinase inhibitor SMR12-like n=1 Tax=Diospyros lotus TaxID=55363 RepID=UPI0022580E2C|nr:cyclin-dependent protein kinase inhibitor SMR12-like [Diospyros lotus]